jgi:hypothetical protein
MLRNVITVFALIASMLIGATAFAADVPTLHQIYQAAQSGRLNDAQGMINQVIKVHPDSAKAHYVDAEILARSGHQNQARQELVNAERLDPGLGFASPQAVQNLKTMLSASHPGLLPATATRMAQPAFPWGLLILGIAAIVIITFIVRAFARPNFASAGYPGNLQPGMSPGYMPGGMGGYGAAPGMGSGIVSGLATGAALGAGMVAGEELAHHFMDGNSGSANVMPQVQPMDTAWDTQGDNMGGTDFGIADNSSWDDNSGFADISGGDDWS